MRCPRLFRQFFSFSVVGLCSNIVGYTAYLFLAEALLDPRLAVAILYPVGVIISYTGNKRFTFNQKNQVFSRGVRYFAVYGFGYFLNLLLIIWLVETLGYPHQIVQAIAVFLCAVTCFIMLRIFVFGDL